MAQPQATSRRTAPPWAVAVGSLVICTHLGLVLTNALTASGPWGSTPDGGPSPPPAFAYAVNRFTAPAYLNPLKLTHNYHFDVNRPALSAVELEIKLRDGVGNVIETVRLPEEGANPWLRHRQGLLARALAADRPAPPPAGEVVAAPGEQVRNVLIWDRLENNSLKLNNVQAHLVPRDRPVMVPSEWSMVLAESYARHLCRTRGAASAEVIRHTREAIPPGALFSPEPPPGAYDELVATFGEMKR